MNGRNLLPVAEARARVLAGASPRGHKDVPLVEALGRTLAAPLSARRTQPPFAAAAVDGFAVRAADIAVLPARLKFIGVSAAGHGFDGKIGAGETVRIFTGAPVPQNADAVLVQEDATIDGDFVIPSRSVAARRHIRVAGVDF